MAGICQAVAKRLIKNTLPSPATGRPSRSRRASPESNAPSNEPNEMGSLH